MNDEEQKPPDLSERTKVFALRVIKMFSAPPNTEVAGVLGKQVLRSGSSIGANYREAHRARSKAEFIAKIGDCLKELDEPSVARQTMRQHCPKGERGCAHQTAYWLELLVDKDEYQQRLASFTTISKESKASLS